MISKNEKVEVSLDGLKSQIETYGAQIKEYLNSHKATIDAYKVSVEKDGEGFAIDFALRAKISPKPN
jgi:hypothetical protein